MSDNSALIAPAPDDPEDRARAACAAEARTARQLAMLQELAEIGMQMARAVRDEALAPGEPASDEASKPPSRFGTGDLGLVYSRIARAVRQTVALETRVADDSQKASVVRERRRIAAVHWAAHERRNEIRGYVTEAIEAQAVERRFADHEVERLLDDLDDRLEAGDVLGEAPVGELVARICADLGVIPDWSLWEDHPWAAEQLTAEAREAERGNDPAPLPKPAPAADGTPPDSG